ncbi:gamma-glutamyltransferase 5a [Tachysurus ichikawai]
MPRRRKDRLRAGVCFAVIFIVLILILIIVCTVKTPESHECKQGMFRKAAVAADSQICSSIGRDVLRSGGSAVDGAIAALICTSVINPQSMGLGGGVIFTIREKTGKSKSYVSDVTGLQSISSVTELQRLKEQFEGEQMTELEICSISVL